MDPACSVMSEEVRSHWLEVPGVFPCCRTVMSELVSCCSAVSERVPGC